MPTLHELDAHLDREPDDLPARHQRARLLAAAGRRTAAVEDLKLAVLDDSVMAALDEDAGPLAPLLDHPHVVLAMDADPDLSAALDALQRRDFAAVLQAPDDGHHAGTAAYLKAVATSELGKTEESLRWSLRTTELLPQVPDAWFNLACALEVLDRRPEAIAAYRKSTEVSPDFGNGFYNLSLLLRRLADLPGSLEAVKSAVACDPRSSLYLYKLAEGWALVGRLAEAEAELRRAMEFDDAVADALRESELFKSTLGADRVRLLLRKPPQKPVKKPSNPT